MRKIPSVVIITSVITQNAREMLEGVLRYAHERGPWRIYQAERRRWGYGFSDWRKWGADAIIAADHHPEREARAIAASGLPVAVLLQPHRMRSPDYPLRGFPCCLFDSRATGRMAADHLSGLGHSNFAFADDIIPESYWSLDRERAFRLRLRETARSSSRRFRYFRYGGATPAERADWMLERPRLARWLASLPRPCAVFAPNDRRGKQVLDACFSEGLSVPGEISVLGVDDDRWICDAAVPTLSSIRFATEPAGYALAACLAGMIAGARRRRIEIPVSPVEVVSRQSTDWMAVRDEKVAQTLKRIAASCSDPALCTASLARQAGLARRTLEVRFKNVTGMTIHEEIERVRLSSARALLREGRETVRSIASLSGYGSVSQFNRAFLRNFGAPPLRYRKVNGER